MVLNGLIVLNGVKFPPTVWIKVHRIFTWICIMHTNIATLHLTIHLIGNMKVCINVPMITTWILCRVTSSVIIDFGEARSNKLQDGKIFCWILSP